MGRGGEGGLLKNMVFLAKWAKILPYHTLEGLASQIVSHTLLVWRLIIKQHCHAELGWAKDQWGQRLWILPLSIAILHWKHKAMQLPLPHTLLMWFVCLIAWLHLFSHIIAVCSLLLIMKCANIGWLTPALNELSATLSPAQPRKLHKYMGGDTTCHSVCNDLKREAQEYHLGCSRLIYTYLTIYFEWNPGFTPSPFHSPPHKCGLAVVDAGFFRWGGWR